MKHILLFIILVFAYSNIYSQSVEELENMADEKANAGDYQYATVIIEKAIAIDSSNHWLWLTKAEYAFELTGPRGALPLAYYAASLAPEEAEPNNRIGEYYSSAGWGDSAIFYYNKAITLAKNDTVANSYLLNRGTAKCVMRDWEGCLVDYEKVLEFFPNGIGILNNISTVYDEVGRVDKSIECLNRIIEIDPTFIGPYINLGFQYSKMDSLDLALHYFSKALEIDANEPLVYNNRGYVYYKKKEYRKALSDINKSIEIYPTNSYAYRNLALVYIDQNNMDEACQTLSFALDYGFTQRYGPEVEELQKKHCKKR